MAEATTLFDGNLLDCVDSSTSLCTMPQLTKVTFQPHITQNIDRDGLIMTTPTPPPPPPPPPPGLEVGRIHLGSISNLVQASTEFYATISFRTQDRTRANAGLAFEGTSQNSWVSQITNVLKTRQSGLMWNRARYHLDVM